MRGKFIVLYGPNNLGKSEQIRRLAEKLSSESSTEKILTIKYPIYELPTGQRIDAELRRQRTLDDLELQREFAANRYTFQPTLQEYLESGVWVLAEDYNGTGIAWGVANGISLETMEDLNKGQLVPDLAILIDGEMRFTAGIERGHRYEDGGKWEESRKVHLMLAERYGWEVVNANQSREEVAEDIWQRVQLLHGRNN